jgi:cation diffusion facilitator family transporter
VPGPPPTASEAKPRAARVSVLSNACLTGFKLAAGIVTGSVSVLSEALHSGLDLVAAIMALLAVRTSRTPADADHQFGHGKFESLSGLAEGALILVAVVMIAWSALHRLIFHHAEIEHVGWGVVVMGVSALVNVFVSRMLFRVARETDSVALEADAWHLRTDVWTSVGVLVGLAIITGAEQLGWRRASVLDPIIALGVAAVITRAAWDIMRQSWGHLVDRSLPEDEIALIESLLREHYPEFSSYHRLRTRKAGSQRYIDLHLEVAGEESVAKAHALCDHLESDLRSRLREAEVMIHVEPGGSDD